MNFLDKTTIELSAGNGGDGIVSWRREAHHANGGPWGGDGGKGGNIIIVGDHNENNLFKLKYIKKVNAENGENGGTKLCHGKNGEDEIIRVPLGTVIYDSKTNERICDITESGQEFIICYGGVGGHGNAHFKSSFNKAPNLFERGEKGERKKVILELKYIADVGIIGFPNAGKSTFINTISNANAKTANYQFTTLNPILGTVKKGNRTLIFADIPGLIEGASDGIGLGFDFLKHIERCKIIIHLVSASDEDNLDVIEAYKTIKNELKKYDDQILNKKMFIVLSKYEFDEDGKKIKELESIVNNKVYKISSFLEDTEELMNAVFEYYEEYCKMKDAEMESGISSYKVIKKVKEDEDVIIYEQLDENLWKVSSKKIDYWANRIPLTTDDNMVRFNQKIEVDKIQEELIKRGAKHGDTFLLGEEIEYEIN